MKKSKGHVHATDYFVRVWFSVEFRLRLVATLHQFSQDWAKIWDLQFDVMQVQFAL